MSRSADAGVQLEPAIPPHLQVPRTRPLAAPAGFTPTTPSYSARFDPTTTVLPFVYVGVQTRTQVRALRDSAAAIALHFTSANGPTFADRAQYCDEAGYLTVVIAAYWDSRSAFRRWQAQAPTDWWHPGGTKEAELGYFCEVYLPGIEDMETTFSHPHAEGTAHLATAFSGQTDTHGYWGSARDRIPRAQVDDLAPSDVPVAKVIGDVVTIQPQDNLFLLRSGQDWSETESAERAFYLDQVRPLLERGMREISVEGRRHGCYFNRYLTLLGPKDEPVERTYSLSAWRSLAHIETWCRSDTHLAIFAAGTQHYRQAGSEARLRLYHEASVLRAGDQSFQYLNCHPGTGLLGG